MLSGALVVRFRIPLRNVTESREDNRSLRDCRTAVTGHLTVAGCAEVIHGTSVRATALLPCVHAILGAAFLLPLEERLLVAQHITYRHELTHLAACDSVFGGVSLAELFRFYRGQVAVSSESGCARPTPASGAKGLDSIGPTQARLAHRALLRVTREWYM